MPTRPDDDDAIVITTPVPSTETTTTRYEIAVDDAGHPVPRIANDDGVFEGHLRLVAAPSFESAEGATIARMDIVGVVHRQGSNPIDRSVADAP